MEAGFFMNQSGFHWSAPYGASLITKHLLIPKTILPALSSYCWPYRLVVQEGYYAARVQLQQAEQLWTVLQILAVELMSAAALQVLAAEMSPIAESQLLAASPVHFAGEHRYPPAQDREISLWPDSGMALRNPY
jgi:hypothetical protein